MECTEYIPEQYIVRFIGFLRTEAGERFKVFSTVSRQHIRIYPANFASYEVVPTQTVAMQKALAAASTAARMLAKASARERQEIATTTKHKLLAQKAERFMLLEWRPRWD